MPKGLSIKSKLVLILLSSSLLSIAVIGFLGWRNNRVTLTDQVFNRMLGIRRTKAEQLEAYFHTMRNQVEVLGQDDMVIEAMIALNRSFRALRNQPITDELNTGLETFYTAQFFPKLFANLPGQADYLLYRPTNPAGIYLQYHYIAANPYQSDAEKTLLDQAKDGSDYSRQHLYYHPRLRNIAQKLGFDDLILVNVESGDVVYTTGKQTDFGSNLLTGPYRQGNEADAFELARANAERGAVQLVDFELYRPGYGTPSSFWSIPLYNGPHLVGIMLVQISLTEVNKIMTYNAEWEEVGLGKTGEIYIVGPDLLLRSDSRFLIEDPTAYMAQLRGNGVPERTIGMIEKLETSILFHKVNSVPARASTQGRDAVVLTTDYRQQPVVAAYQPVTLETLQWGLVAKIDQAEAFAPLYTFQNNLLIATVLMTVLYAFGAVLVAGGFLRPIHQVITGARQARSGQLGVALPVTSKDELGELAAGFNELLQGLHQQTTRLGQKQQEVERLQLIFLPAILAQRLQKGETQILEQATAVSLLMAGFSGWQTLSSKKSAPDLLQLMQELTADLDQAAGRQDLEKFTAGPQRFFAICALSRPHLDHSRRAVEFALAAQQTMQRFNQKHGAALQLGMAIHAGAISAGVSGITRPTVELWGEIITVVEALHIDASPNTILVSQVVYDQLKEQYKFQRYTKAGRDTARPAAWVLEGTLG